PQKSYRTTLTLFTMAFGIFLYAIDMTIITNAVPKITAEFHTVNHIPWYGSAFFLTNAPFQSVWGKAFRYFETKRTYIASIFVFELGNLVAGAAPNSPALIAGRAIAGIGGAGIITGAFTIIALTAPPGKAPAYTAVMGITFGCASVLGPLLGGVFTDRLTWRWCFYINLPLGVLTAAMVALYIGEHKSDSEPAASLYEAMCHLDPVGTGLVLLSAGCFLTAMQFGSQSANWTQTSTVALLAASGVVALLFIIVEWRLGAKSMIQLRLLRQGAVAANAACIFFVSAVYFSLLYILPVYFQSISGVSAEGSGFRSIPLILGVSAFTIISNLSMPKVDWLIWLTLGPLIMTAGAVCLYLLDLETALPQVIGFQILVAAGVGLVLQVPMVSNQSSVNISEIAEVTGLTLFFETLGSLLFTSAVQAVFVDGIVRNLAQNGGVIDPRRVLEVGAVELGDMFSASELRLVLSSYLYGYKRSLLMEIACA
ncbi:MFS general substrate transporter, partial [Thozetella sp. PMI_491]